jgi:hypothetical protein
VAVAFGCAVMVVPVDVVVVVVIVVASWYHAMPTLH